jgi:hypothetical protein
MRTEKGVRGAPSRTDPHHCGRKGLGRLLERTTANEEHSPGMPRPLARREAEGADMAQRRKARVAGDKRRLPVWRRRELPSDQLARMEHQCVRAAGRLWNRG